MAGGLRKWVVMPSGRSATDVLAAIASSAAPGQIAHLLGPHLAERFGDHGPALTTELKAVREGRDQGNTRVERRWKLLDGIWQPGDHGATRRAAAGTSATATPLGNLVLAYGRDPRPVSGDSFDFSDTEYPYRRVASLLGSRPSLTDPMRFLERISAKAHEVGAPRQRRFLERLCGALSSLLAPGTRRPRGRGCREVLCPAEWAKRGFPVREGWAAVEPGQRRAASVVVDLARHAFDAFPRCESPFDQSALVLMDRPDRYCSADLLPRLLRCLDTLLPRGQFILTLSRAAQDRVPHEILDASLGKPAQEILRVPPYHSVRILPRPARIPRGGVALVQVDGTLPNFALMQLSRHLKAQGHRVGLSVGGAHQVQNPAAVYASCVFTGAPSAKRAESLRERFGERLVLGGSGVDLKLRLGPRIESLAPDYSLYPGLGDRAMGFLTRGCPGRCAFCSVPVKEGAVRQVADLDMLLQGSRRKKLILLDDNLLAYPKSVALLEQMVHRGLSVNFNQTLDLRRLTAEHAELLRRLRCSNLAFHRRAYHFSLNDCRGLDEVRRRYGLLRVTAEDNVEFICMYGYNTSLAEDLERLQFLRSLPRAYVFMQRYRPVPGGPPPDVSRLFDERADEHLDALVKVVFTQNMKNVERYYRWLCLEYARQRGRINLGVVDTLFRYNHRHRRGAFLRQLEELVAACRAERKTGAGVARADDARYAALPRLSVEAAARQSRGAAQEC